MARHLGKILSKFHVRFWQDNVRQEIAKTHYIINLAKFLARFWQDHARQSRQEIAKMCYKILAKFLARFSKIIACCHLPSFHFHLNFSHFMGFECSFTLDTIYHWEPISVG